MSASAPHRFPLIAAGFFGATGIILGALGAHKLQPMLLETGMARSWETASKYHLLHALALLGAAAFVRGLAVTEARRITWAAWLWSVGIVLFSFSLYWYAVGGPRILGRITPIGGLVFIAGWLCVLAAGFGKRTNP